MKEYTGTPAGWMRMDVPEVDKGMVGYYWVWRISTYADSYGNPITEYEPEIVRIHGAEELCDRRIEVFGEKGSHRSLNSPGMKMGSRRYIVLWKGPLNHG